MADDRAGYHRRYRYWSESRDQPDGHDGAYIAGKMVIRDYWKPEVFGEERGDILLQASTLVEADIWAIANDVLTTQQQRDLADLITEWHAENPEQIYPWMIRMSEFSGQRAASLNAVKQSGGMLKAVHQVRETAEEFQAFGERVLFYLQRAPGMTSNAMETSVLQLLGGRHVAEVMEDAGRFVSAVERLVDVVEALPGARGTPGSHRSVCRRRGGRKKAVV